MKYVHITPFKNISAIKKNGIRGGVGGVHKGVFAVPLTPVMFSSIFEAPMWSGLRDKYLGSGQVSSWRIWHWWARRRDGQKSKPNKVAAIVFRIPDDCWPVEVSLEIGNPALCKQAVKLMLESPEDFILRERDIEWYREYLHEEPDDELGECATYIRATAKTERGLGRLWHFVTQDDDVNASIDQVVMPGPIPPRFIERIVPLYRSNKRFKKIKERYRRDDFD